MKNWIFRYYWMPKLHNYQFQTAGSAIRNVQILNCIHNIFDSRDAEVAISIIEQLQSWFYDLWSQKVKEILDNHRSVWCSVKISTKDEELDLPLLLDA
jgi:hypothetical protein